MVLFLLYMLIRIAWSVDPIFHPIAYRLMIVGFVLMMIARVCRFRRMGFFMSLTLFSRFFVKLELAVRMLGLVGCLSSFFGRFGRIGCMLERFLRFHFGGFEVFRFYRQFFEQVI